MVLTTGTLAAAFGVYWQEMERCRANKAYWSLLHVTVCIPDICGALESDNGESTKAGYIAWSDHYLPDQLLTGAERYRMRCKVLHQGRASTDQPGRYDGFAFTQPPTIGRPCHREIDGKTLVLDVGQLAVETQAGAERWFQALESAPTTAAALNTERYLPSLVQVRQVLAPRQIDVFGGTVPIIINRTS